MHRFKVYATEFGEQKLILSTDDLANASTFAEGRFASVGYDKVVVFDYAGSSPRVAIEHLGNGRDLVCEWEKKDSKKAVG